MTWKFLPRNSSLQNTIQTSWATAIVEVGALRRRANVSLLMNESALLGEMMKHKCLIYHLGESFYGILSLYVNYKQKFVTVGSFIENFVIRRFKWGFVGSFELIVGSS